jgi:hypothetical protein
LNTESGGCLIFWIIVSSGLLKKRNLKNCWAPGFWELVLGGHELRVVFDEQKHSNYARLVSPMLHLSPSFQEPPHTTDNDYDLWCFERHFITIIAILNGMRLKEGIIILGVWGPVNRNYFFSIKWHTKQQGMSFKFGNFFEFKSQGWYRWSSHGKWHVWSCQYLGQSEPSASSRPGGMDGSWTGNSFPLECSILVP